RTHAVSGRLRHDRAEIIVNGRTGLAVLAALGLAERAEPPVARGDAPRCPIRYRLTLLAGLVGEEPVTELRVVLVCVEPRVRAIRLHGLAGRDGIRQPPIVRAGMGKST